jgi:hypothetical protein
MLNEMFYACWQYLSRKTRVRIPMFDVFLFALSLAIMVVSARFQPDSLRGLIGSLIRFNLQPVKVDLKIACS